MRQSISRPLTILLVVAFTRPSLAAPTITAQEVKQSMKRGIDFLKRRQNKANGTWDGLVGYPGGLTALVTLSLLNSGLTPKDPTVARALTFLRNRRLHMTYSVSLQTMVLCVAEPKKDKLLIQRNVAWLEKMQLSGGHPNSGGWAYSDATRQTRGNGDPSNTQFAILALHEAERAGVPIKQSTWKAARDYWVRRQRSNGSWAYFQEHRSTGSMTCAGIASLIIANGKLSTTDAVVSGSTIQCCGQKTAGNHIDRALNWLGKHFEIEQNPKAGSYFWFYYLYGLERVGRLSGRRLIGGQDWYRKGARVLVKGNYQAPQGYWEGKGHAERSPIVATSLALLFLAKGRRPVVISKAQHGKGFDWDMHRSGIPNLVRRVEKAWRKDLTWQTVSLKAATLADLQKTPVLFISGQQSLQLNKNQKNNLRDYVNQGGFVLAEACDGRGCNGAAFDRQFRTLMKELFPQSPLRPLPADHSIWIAEEKVIPGRDLPKDFVIEGIDACCRTSVVYCNRSLSCLWELAQRRGKSSYPQAVQTHVAGALNMGANILAYATNRQLKYKLEQSALMQAARQKPMLGRGELKIPKIQHTGGADDAPNALRNLTTFFSREIKTPAATQRKLLSVSDPALYEFPIVFMHGRRSFRFSKTQRKALRTYLERGGVLFADSICASEKFSKSLREEVRALLPEYRLRRVAPDHPIFTRAFRGYDLSQVTIRNPANHVPGTPLKSRLQSGTPVLEGVEINGRLAVIFSPIDISCGLENRTSLECKGYSKRDAARMGVNILLYALQN